MLRSIPFSRNSVVSYCVVHYHPHRAARAESAMRIVWKRSRSPRIGHHVSPLDDTDYADFKFLSSALSNQCSSVSSEVVLSSAPSKASCFLKANKSMLLSAVDDAHCSLRHQTSCQTNRCNTLLISINNREYVLLDLMHLHCQTEKPVKTNELSEIRRCFSNGLRV